MKDSKKASKKKTNKDPLAEDLSSLLLSKKWKKVNFELQPKSKSITLRLSDDLLAALKDEAEKEGIDYQKFIRLTLERAIRKTS